MRGPLVGWTFPTLLVALVATGCGSGVMEAGLDGEPEGKQTLEALSTAAIKGELQNGVPISDLSGAARSQVVYTLAVPEGATRLEVTLGSGTSASNDADLYVRFGSAPTVTRFDCRSWRYGLTERCSFDSPRAGTYYVLVHGYTAYRGATLEGSFEGAQDQVPPEVVILEPAPGGVVGGKVPLSASASDDVGVTAVEFYLDGALLGADVSSPYALEWLSSLVPDGSHAVSARAYDAAGNGTTSSTVSFVVRNGGGGGGGSGAELSVHTSMGLPDGSTDDPGNTEHYLSVKPHYVLSYDSARKVPNWVSWELNASYLGSSGRSDDFRPDDTLPSSMPQAGLADYRGSGFDRGHLCPSGDRTLDASMNSTTFYLSNMIPQAPANNQGPWAKLEDYSRTLARQGRELFIIAGGTFSASSRSIGEGVSVPDSTWKVIVVLDAVGQGAADVSSSTRVIAVEMPNDDALISRSADWRSFRVSVDQVETATGMDLLADVEVGVQAEIEARVDAVP